MARSRLVDNANEVTTRLYIFISDVCFVFPQLLQASVWALYAGDKIMVLAIYIILKVRLK
jgi:hypothetical protein